MLLNFYFWYSPYLALGMIRHVKIEAFLNISSFEGSVIWKSKFLESDKGTLTIYSFFCFLSFNPP